MRLTPIRWWPLVGLSAMALLGVAVRHGSTEADEWFAVTGRDHPVLGRLLFFTDPRVLYVLVGAALIAALWRRRWRLAAVVALTPIVGVIAARLLKEVFGREKGELFTLAYPSGHVTATVAVLGMVVLVLNGRRWAMAAAAAWTVPAVLGQSFTYHYFTDTVGAVLLATSLVCLAAWAAGLDRCQPGCDVRHSTG